MIGRLIGVLALLALLALAFPAAAQTLTNGGCTISCTFATTTLSGVTTATGAIQGIQGSTSVTAFGSSANPNTGMNFNGTTIQFVSNALANWALDNISIYNPSLATGQWSNSAASATVPNFFPNRADLKAGIGADAAGDVSLIANNAGTATEVIRVTGLGPKVAGNLSFTGSVPSLVAGGGCGGGSPTVDANATNNSGRVTVGTATTSCVITFATAFTTFNHCQVTSETTLAAFGYTYTLAAITATATTLGGDIIDYRCDGV